MAKKPTKRDQERERAIEEIAAATADPNAASALDALRRALASSTVELLVRASAVAAKHHIEALVPDLLAAYPRFLVDPVKTDPGCLAKVAILEALDHCEHRDHEPFLSATRYTQLEKRWGPPEDTAIGVRSRGAAGLVRQRYEDVLPILGSLLADPEARVRETSASALAHHGDRDGAALLILRIRAGDPEPTVLAECIRALFILAPDHGTPLVAPWLQDPDRRELAAYALVDANRDESIRVLIDALATMVLAGDRDVLLRALGTSRRPLAREHLLHLIAEGNISDARAAIASLAIHAFDPRLRADVLAAAARNTVDLAAPLAQHFPETPP